MGRSIKSDRSPEELEHENEELRARLEESQEVLAAIRAGQVDALAVDGPDGAKVYTLEGADHPYRIFVETMNEGAMTVSTDGTILYCNRVLAEVVGLSLGQTLGLDVRQIVDPTDLLRWDELLQEAVENPRRVELHLRHADGTAIPVQMSARGISSINSVCVVVTDLRGQKLQEKLRASEERLRLALEAGQLGTWDLELMTGTVTWDAKQYELFGLSSDDQPITIDQWYALVHPDDVAEVKEAVSRALITGSFAGEFRVLRSEGPAQWIAGIGAVLKDEKGHPLRMIGVNYDVTARRRSEMQLRSFAGQLEHLVQERTQELVQSQEHLRALATDLSLTEQRERKRLATELHDHLQQVLVLGKLTLGQGKRKFATQLACADMIDKVDNVLSEALTYTRTLVAELSPPVLRDHGLSAGLKWLAEYMKKYEMSVTVHVSGDEVGNLPEDQAVLLFQSVRELLMNSWKHAGTGQSAVHWNGAMVFCRST